MPTPQTQVTVTVRTFAQRFSSTRRGARLARRLAAHQLEAWGVPYGSAASDTLLLIVAELAANAVRHGRVPGRDFALRLVHRPAAALVRVEVSDTHPALPVRLAQAPADADGGRGLLLVDALASRWEAHRAGQDGLGGAGPRGGDPRRALHVSAPGRPGPDDHPR